MMNTNESNTVSEMLLKSLKAAIKLLTGSWTMQHHEIEISNDMFAIGNLMAQ